MITLEQALKTADYHIEEGSRYCWKCFGSNARYLDFYTSTSLYFSVVYDTKTQEVYQASVGDYENSYILISPLYRVEYEKEARERGVEPYAIDDNIHYTILEVDDDFLEKAHAIVRGEPYDTRIKIELEFSDEEFLAVARAAHELDITINQYIEQALEAEIARHT
jgi:hypothetical protein